MAELQVIALTKCPIIWKYKARLCGYMEGEASHKTVQSTISVRPETTKLSANPANRIRKVGHPEKAGYWIAEQKMVRLA